MLDVEKIKGQIKEQIKEQYVVLRTGSGCEELNQQDDVLVDLVCTAAALGFEKGFAVGRGGVKE